MVVSAEMGANNLTKNDFICLSVDGLRPSPEFVKALRQRHLNVYSSAEQSEKFNCDFELQLENVKFDTAESVEVRSKLFDLRSNEKAEGHRTLIEDGEYVVKKFENGYWWIREYSNHWLPGNAVAGGGWFEDDCTGASFNINQIDGAPGERVFLRIETGDPNSWRRALRLGWIGWAKVQGMHCSHDGECKDAKQAKLLLDNASKDTNQLSGQYVLDVGDQHFQGSFMLEYRKHPVRFVCE